jgi:Ca-activated chloride channel family protein
VSGWHFVHRDWVHLTWAAIAIVAVLAVLELRNRDALGRFLSPEMQRRLATRPSRDLAIGRMAMFAISLGYGILAIMRPQAGSHTEHVSGSTFSTDVIVVLDVSRSMLAEDVKPYRLKRAKTEIDKMARLLPAARVGLVAFAGRAALMCPLTPDHSFFSLALGGVDTNRVSRGGTRIGDALRTAVKAFPKEPGSKMIVLITDGEDHESFPLDAAEDAKKAGVHVIAVGLGSEAGAPIFVTDPKTQARTQVMHDGAPVISKLDGETLRKIATATEGVYVPAGTSALDLESIVKANVTPIAKRDADAATREVQDDEYAWFVLGALVALLGAVWLGSVAGERR